MNMRRGRDKGFLLLRFVVQISPLTVTLFSRPKGVTVSGEVCKIIPVTDLSSDSISRQILPKSIGCLTSLSVGGMVNVLQGCGTMEAGLFIPSFIGKHTFVFMLNDIQDMYTHSRTPRSQSLNCVVHCTLHTIHKI